MACKHLGARLEQQTNEIGGSLVPQYSEESICKLRRSPSGLGWLTKCEETPHNGPCWYWQDVKGSEPDPDFG